MSMQDTVRAKITDLHITKSKKLVMRLEAREGMYPSDVAEWFGEYCCTELGIEPQANPARDAGIPAAKQEKPEAIKAVTVEAEKARPDTGDITADCVHCVFQPLLPGQVPPCMHPDFMGKGVGVVDGTCDHFSGKVVDVEFTPGEKDTETSQEKRELEPGGDQNDAPEISAREVTTGPLPPVPAGDCFTCSFATISNDLGGKSSQCTHKAGFCRENGVYTRYEEKEE